jgi:hypothetical protein
LIENKAGFNLDTSSFGIDTPDSTHMACKIHDNSASYRLPGETSATTTRQNRNLMLIGYFMNGADIINIAGKGYADGRYLAERAGSARARH